MTRTIQSEEWLLKQFVLGDERALKYFFQTYKNVIFGYALKMVKSKDYADELVQEIFIKLWQNRDSIDTSKPLAPYLYRITHNHVLNFLRKAANENRLKNEVFYLSVKASNKTEDDLISSEYEYLSQQAIGLLPPQRKVVFEMSRREGKSYDEIASELGISKNTVKEHIVKAIKTIKLFLRPYTDYLPGFFVFFFFQ